MGVAVGVMRVVGGGMGSQMMGVKGGVDGLVGVGVTGGGAVGSPYTVIGGRSVGIRVIGGGGTGSQIIGVGKRGQQEAVAAPLEKRTEIRMYFCRSLGSLFHGIIVDLRVEQVASDWWPVVRR